METVCVLCAVRVELLYFVYVKFGVQKLNICAEWWAVHMATTRY